MRRRLLRDGLGPVRREASEAVSRLRLGSAFGFQELVDSVARFRGTRLDIRAVPSLGKGEVSALWLSMRDIELILHVDTDSELYREQIILHELAHMILGHDLQETGSMAQNSLLPDLPAALIQGALARCRERSRIELAAEVLADLLAKGLSASRVPSGGEPLKFSEVFG